MLVLSPERSREAAVSCAANPLSPHALLISMVAAYSRDVVGIDSHRVHQQKHARGLGNATCLIDKPPCHMREEALVASPSSSTRHGIPNSVYFAFDAMPRRMSKSYDFGFWLGTGTTLPAFDFG